MANNYAFDNSVPAANNNPSEDQPLMLINNQSSASIWQTDHIGFGTDGGGLHKQVTFATNQSAPSLTVDGVSGLYANLSSALSQLFFQNSTQNFQLTGLPVTNSGTNYGITTPWGITINFGTGTTNTSGNATVTYAIAMSTPVYFVNAMVNTGGSIPSASSNYTISVNNVGATTMGVKIFLAATTPATSFYYIAIGKST